MTQEILYGVASQAFELVTDRPLSSVTSVAVWAADADDTSTAEVATSGSPSIDSATEAMTAAAGPDETDPTKISVASTAGFATGRRAYISGAGMSETFEIERVHANAAIYARHPLVNAYAIGATVSMSTRATVNVDAAWSADINKLSPAANPNPRYRVRWVVNADDGSTGVYFRNADLVRYPSSPPVSPLDVDAAYPGWLDALPPDYRESQGRPLIIEATRLVRMDLWSRGIADQSLRVGEVFAALVIDRAVWSMFEANGLRGADVTQQLGIAKDRYDRRIAGLVDSPVLAVDTTSGGAASTSERGGRLMRR